MIYLLITETRWHAAETYRHSMPWALNLTNFSISSIPRISLGWTYNTLPSYLKEEITDVMHRTEKEIPLDRQDSTTPLPARFSHTGDLFSMDRDPLSAQFS